MPIVSHNNHPSLSRIAKEGFDVLSPESAIKQDIRELHIGFLNMMPDAAFLATERQFFRLVSAATNIVQIYIHPIQCKGVERSEQIKSHIEQYYEDFNDISVQGLDALIVTGANPKFKDLTQEDYWHHATEIFAWAEQNVVSVFYSCLASHAVLQAQCGLVRKPLPEKLWGVYPQRVIDTKHPLVSNINTLFNMPHSRGNDISETSFVEKKLKILVASEESGVSIATSPDGFRQIFCQGHPEYDTSSLLREYMREVHRFITLERKDLPLLPKNYGSEMIHAQLEEFFNTVTAKDADINEFPMSEILEKIDNTWRDTAKAIFSNWLGLVYRVTHVDRNKQFMDGIDPENPIKQWYQ